MWPVIKKMVRGGRKEGELQGVVEDGGHEGGGSECGGQEGLIVRTEVDLPCLSGGRSQDKLAFVLDNVGCVLIT
jgi:hypothetical protein